MSAIDFPEGDGSIVREAVWNINDADIEPEHFFGVGAEVVEGVSDYCTEYCSSIAGKRHPRRGEQAADTSPPAIPTSQTQADCFLSRRRSRSLSPPQIPKRSSFARAYSRHSTRTSHD